MFPNCYSVTSSQKFELIWFTNSYYVVHENNLFHLLNVDWYSHTFLFTWFVHFYIASSLAQLSSYTKCQAFYCLLLFSFFFLFLKKKQCRYSHWNFDSEKKCWRDEKKKNIQNVNIIKINAYGIFSYKLLTSFGKMCIVFQIFFFACLLVKICF